MGGFQQRPWTPTKRRGPIAAEFNGPGPACVTLAPLIGNMTNDSKKERAPSFSFGLKHDERSESIGPGPGQYNVTGLNSKGKDTPPAISLYSRNKENKPVITPAPGDYNPEKSAKSIFDISPKYTFGMKTQFQKPNVNPAPGQYKLERSGTIILGHSPKYTFGLKIPVEKPSDTPAPNVYNIPTAMGNGVEGGIRTAPAFSISGRPKEFCDDKVTTPGPGTYEYPNVDVIKPKSPAYSVSSRYQLPTDDNLKPGPGTYSPEKIQLDYPPAHSFGIKHSPYTFNSTVH